MNTILKNTVACNILEGLQMRFLEYSILENKSRALYTTTKEDLSYGFEHDRVFNNVDIVENMIVGIMESPHKIRNTEIKVKSFKPIKRYENGIKVLMKYDMNIKG